MFYLTLILPIILAAFLYLFYKDKVCNWEYALLFGVSIASYAITSMVMYKSNVADTEYFNNLAVKVRYYEPWNEYIHRTCSYTTCSGSGKTQSCTTHYYDCSYVKYHREYWVIISDTGTEINISVAEFNKLKALWKAQRVFVDMERNYHTQDGDAYDYGWNSLPSTAQNITSAHYYDNKTQSANTIFKFADMTDEEAKKEGLYAYPKIYSGYDQPTILGVFVADSTRRKYDYLNGSLGAKKEIKLFVLYFWNKGRSIATQQKNYWKGGNKNELVICIGVDRASKKVQWVEAFSWSKIPTVESNIKAWYAANVSFSLEKFNPVLAGFIYSDWHRRNFEDFDYIEIELSQTQVVWLWAILSVLCIGVSVFVVKNGVDRDC